MERVDFGCGPQDAWQSPSTGTRAQAILVRQACSLEARCEGLRNGASHQSPQHVTNDKGADATSIRLLQRDDAADADGSKGRGRHIDLREAPRGAMQELAVVLVLQKDTEVLVGSS